MAKVALAQESTISNDAKELQAAVAELVRVYQFRDRDRICCYDVSVTQCYALETLVEQGAMRQGELAQRLFLDKSVTSRVVGTLIKKGYVEQAPDPSDGRAIMLQATRSGRALCTKISAELVGQQEQLLGDLAPEVRAGVISVIRRLAQAADARFRSGVSAGPGCCATNNTCG
jgi:MarR family transcriptional regulator, 2-MHQ and catechol-resistance regulon repressor